MLEQEALEALQVLFRVVYPLSLVVAIVAALRQGQNGIALLRAVLALFAGSVAQTIFEMNGEVLGWGRHIVIDLCVLFVITLPPRRYWQAAMGGILFSQILLHAIWGLSDAFGPIPDMARWHWLFCVVAGFAKSALLIFWAGGGYVQALLNRIAGWHYVLRVDSREGRAAGQ